MQQVIDKDFECLHAAAARKDLDIFAVLVEAGFSLSRKTSSGKTPFHFIRSPAKRKAAEDFFIPLSRDVQEDPCVSACLQGDADRLARLLDANSSSTFSSVFGASQKELDKLTTGMQQTLLHIACWKGKADIARLLLQRGASANAIDKVTLTFRCNRKMPSRSCNSFDQAPMMTHSKILCCCFYCFFRMV